MSETSEQALNGMIKERHALTETLSQLSSISQYNQWMYQQFSECLGQRILEVGSGVGNITGFLLERDREVVATDVIAGYREALHSRFSDNPRIEIGTFNLDGRAPAEYITKPFDTVVCLNVLEHIEDDMAALGAMRSALKDDGTLVLLVPAHQFLYGAFDEAVGHFRRYSRRQVRERLNDAGFEVDSLVYFNIAATLPWLINGRILRRSYLPNEQVSLADKLVPVLRLEKLIGPPMGISLIAIARKSGPRVRR